MRLAALALLLAVAGCATGTVTVTPYTTPEVEAERARCLEQPDGVWMEMWDRAQCLVPGVPAGGDPT